MYIGIPMFCASSDNRLRVTSAFWKDFSVCNRSTRVRITIVSLCPSSRRFSRGVTHPRALSILQKKGKRERKKKKLVTCIDASIAFNEDTFPEVLRNERRAVRTLTIAYSFSTRIEFPHSSSYERFDHNVIVNANCCNSTVDFFSDERFQHPKSAKA